MAENENENENENDEEEEEEMYEEEELGDENTNKEIQQNSSDTNFTEKKISPKNNSKSVEYSVDENILKSVKKTVNENKADQLFIQGFSETITVSISVYASTETEIPFLISSSTSSPNLILGGGIGPSGPISHSPFFGMGGR